MAGENTTVDGAAAQDNTVDADTSNAATDGTVNNDEGNGGSMYEGVGKVVKGTSQVPDEDDAHEEEHGDGGDNEGEEAGEGGSDESGDGSEDNPSETDFSAENNFGYVDETNNETFSQVINVLIEKEVPRDVADTIFKEAMSTGDLDKVDMDMLKEKVGEATSGMIMRQLTQYKNEQVAKATERNETIYGYVGGKEMWDTISEWSKDNYTQEEVESLNSMLNSGGHSAELAAKSINDKYKASSDYKEPADMLEPDGGQHSGEAPLDRAEYYELANKEHSRVGGARAHVLRSLQSRRAAGRKRGI